ncbi:hypothetical protein QJV45_16865 [Listeria booriae]|uniref:hypothetical protein n=1 Tax=Listeria booriae TaxID=1552123 RepID=UPI0028802E62|nr:hypothetical protein [Listeria booriae]MDT0112140.1 hypothetical protein [Listeria booriae]
MHNKQTKRKWIRLLLLVFILVGCHTYAVQAAEVVKDVTVTEDPIALHKAYKDYSFPLMTKEPEGLNPLSKIVANMGVGVKSFSWEAAKITGQINAVATGFLFDFDAMKPIRQPILNMTNGLASSMLGLATTLGAGIMALIMVIKFVMEQNFKRAVLTFCMAVLVTTCFVVMKDPVQSKRVMDFATEVDTAIANKLAEKVPVIDGSTSNAEMKGKSGGKTIEAAIFNANVITPYLIANYGTSSLDKINELTITYNGKTYQRVGLLMGNGDSSKVDDDFVSELAKIEYDTLNNTNVGWKRSISQAFLILFFLQLNLIQFVIYFILFLVKNMLGFLLIFLFPLSLFTLFFAMLSSNMNPFKNIAKGYLTIALIKAGVTFLALFYVSYMMLAYRASNDFNFVFVKMVVILFYILLPLVLYFFRRFLFMMLLATFTNREVTAHAMMQQFRHPRTKVSPKARREGADKKDRKGKGKDGKDPKREGGIGFDTLIRTPQNIAKKLNEARKGMQERQQAYKGATQESHQRIQDSQARQARSQKEKDLEKTFANVPIGHGKHGAITEGQQRRQEKAADIQQKYENQRRDRAQRAEAATDRNRIVRSGMQSQRRNKLQEKSEARKGSYATSGAPAKQQVRKKGQPQQTRQKPERPITPRSPRVNKQGHRSQPARQQVQPKQTNRSVAGARQQGKQITKTPNSNNIVQRREASSRAKGSIQQPKRSPRVKHNAQPKGNVAQPKRRVQTQKARRKATAAPRQPQRRK